MARVKALFYLPLRDNDSRDLKEEISQVKANVYIRFDGWTSMGEVEGAFRMPDGTLALDTNAVYSVILEEEEIPELESILIDFKSRTNQAAIYLEIQKDIDVRFL